MSSTISDDPTPSPPHTRDFHPGDIDGIVDLWERTVTRPADAVYSLSEVLASCREDHALVAVDDNETVVGAIVGRAAHAQGWIVFFGVTPSRHDSTVASALVNHLARKMGPLGLDRLSAIVSSDEARFDDYVREGFSARENLRYLERMVTVSAHELAVLRELGGHTLPPDLWTAVGGMHREKELLELRLITPLDRPDLAVRFGVVPPRAVILFGPPGTGKTTFAKAVAARLGWSFVEVFPSRLAVDGGGLASGLRDTFGRIAEINRVVVFIDEVEEIASRRTGEPAHAGQGVTNELLKLIPEFRSSPGRLLICATNFIRALDTAFLRHGRFDYVIPIGLPDREARAAIWNRYLPPAARGVDVERLVAASDGLTPADIEYAARRAAQDALERALRDDAPDKSDGPSTADYLNALSATRATVASDVVADFLDDIDQLARL
ncbi:MULTISPECIES: ATP-binding protein [Gordonia]|nr:MULTISPECIES: GNAT family N-acetyltransferase [Gordonia]WCB35367.1 GNAT family N-acetyltransferase [Gordonia polyisoprenivorans]